MEFYSTVRMNELVLSVFICVKSKNIILNEKQSCRKISFMLKQNKTKQNNIKLRLVKQY